MPNSEPVPLDLIPVDVLAPRVRKAAVTAIVVGAVVGVVFWFFTSVWWGIGVAAVVAVPALVSATITLRRRIWLDHNVLFVQRAFGTRRVNVSRLASVEVMIRAARLDQVSVRFSDGPVHITVALALYTHGGGRELPIMALRALADSLWTCDLVPAAALASVLVEQLKAEARDAHLGDRPLYRAVEMVRKAGRAPHAVLTDREVALLIK